MIREKTREAIAKLPVIKPFRFSSPVEFKVELMERVQLPGTLGKPWIRIHDGRTYSVTAQTLTEAYSLAK